jgi:opacity protein-like surface antigen
MKKIILTAAAVLAFTFANAQEARFGVTAGVDFASAKFKSPDFTINESETGVFVGAFVDITASEKFHVQPELLFVFIEDSKQLQLPILAKYYVAQKFSLLVGPDLLFNLDEKVDGFKNFGIGLDLGGVYDINENFMIEAKYNFGLTNLLENAPSDTSLKISGLFVGVGYKF